MAAVASNHPSEESRNGDSERFSGPGPSFTAVNGRASASPPEKSKASPEQPKAKDAIENSNLRSIQHNTQQERALTPLSARPPRPSSQVEHRASPAPNPPIERPFQPPPNPQGGPDGSRPQQTHDQTYSRPPSVQQPNTANTSPQKRKRSTSDDYDRPDTSAFHSHGYPPPSAEQQRGYSMDNGRPRDSEPMSPHRPYPPRQEYAPDPYARQEHGPPHEPYPHPDRHQMARNDYERHVDPRMAPAQQSRPYYPDPNDARLVDVLHRDLHGASQPYHEPPLPGRENFVTPEEDDEHLAQHYGDYGSARTQAQMDIERKRRKRVFSNRTKTGCMTCRRRKKKCDEQHPECNNCLRGGFVCEGYTMPNTWQKPSNAKAPIPLQSKNGYGPPGPYRGPPYQSRYEHSPDFPPPPPHMAPNNHPPPEGDRVKPILVDEERDPYGKPSPPSMHSKPQWNKTARPYPSNPPQLSRYHPEADQRPASGHEPSYDHPEPNTMQPPPNVHRANSSSSHSQYSGQSSHAPSQSNAQAVAQTALSHPTSLRPSPARRDAQLTEREKMLKGNYYHPFSPALMEDRERCLAATWRFNNATNPSHGASPEERSRLFRAILSLKPSPEPLPITNGTDAPPPPQPTMPLPFGSCGSNVVVEAPFHCDYGYNITIGDDVLIGPDCRISDTCSVTIGARCIFSPNVKLVCATYPIDPRRRMGSGGQALGRNIVIEEDCWIGSNVTILAGVRVGKSSTVGAGSLLHQDVPRFTVVAGNPAKVSRGIYDGNADGS